MAFFDEREVVMSNPLISCLHEYPIVAAINNNKDLEEALESTVNVIFLLKSDIFTIKESVDKVQAKGKLVFVHADLMEGIGKDSKGIEYLCDVIKPDGIITTRGNHIKTAKEKGILTIQRLFLLDSINLNSGIKAVKQFNPDAVEILPGIMPKITKLMVKETRKPVITGGLIMEKSDIIDALKVGAIGVSVSKTNMWEL